MRLITLVSLAALLSACGAAAPPVPRDAPKPGISVSGESYIGVTATL